MRLGSQRPPCDVQPAIDCSRVSLGYLTDLGRNRTVAGFGTSNFTLPLGPLGGSCLIFLTALPGRRVKIAPPRPTGTSQTDGLDIIRDSLSEMSRRPGPTAP